MKKYVLSIGLNDKDAKIQKIGVIEAYKVVENACKNLNIDYTIYECNGAYTNSIARVFEKSLRLEIYDFEDINQDVFMELIKNLVNILKIALNQESIAVEVVDVNSFLL